MKYTEEEIIKHLQWESASAEREQGAAMLLEQYAGLLWSVCRRRLENDEDIRECVNSTFAQVCLHPEKYDADKGSLKNYLCMMADRKAIDCYHENARRQQAEENFAQEEQMVSRVTGNPMEGIHAVSGVSMAAADGYTSGEERAAEKLEEALVQLDPIDSQILRMKYYDGMTYQEIAAQLGLTEGTVKMRSLRSRKKLFKILIVVLILALLAACAVVALRRYQFTERGGVSQSDEPLMYEMVDGGYSWRKGSIEYVVEEAVFRIRDEEALTGNVVVCVKAYWFGGQVEGWNQEFYDAASVELSGVNNEGILRSEGVDTIFYNLSTVKADYEGATECIECEIFFHWSLEVMGQESVVMPLYLDREWITDLTMWPTEFREYESSNKSIQLLNGARWIVGPAVEGEAFTVVSLIGTEGEDWSLHTPLYASRYYLPEEQKKPITLTGEDGTVYRISRVEDNGDMFAVDENVTQYELYFPGVPAGEYQLNIPSLYYFRDWISEPFTLQLPEEVGVRTDCDVTTLFPDGSGFHITGITKQEHIGGSYRLMDGELVPEYIYYWEYVLDVERIAAGQPEFWMARLRATEQKQAAASIT
ncbi:MAG: sigma-70 family RNA polymerase sigma factor, partial [Lachnospiraceae bacterium]|nr:sigma-70 family RNA polymerase sigma factor [Lachnospiraceae bacterium]